MSRARPLRRFAMALAGLLAGLPAAWAIQREIKSKCHAYAEAPVRASDARVRLVEVFSTSGAATEPYAEQTRGTRVRYLNRANQLPSAFMLEGEVTCVNRSPKLVRAIKLTVVPMNAFHEPIKSAFLGEDDGKQLMLSLSPGSSRVISWKQRAPSSDVYQVAVVVTAVMFDGDEVWLAPNVELIDD